MTDFDLYAKIQETLLQSVDEQADSLMYEVKKAKKNSRAAQEGK